MRDRTHNWFMLLTYGYWPHMINELCNNQTRYELQNNGLSLNWHTYSDFYVGEAISHKFYGKIFFVCVWWFLLSFWQFWEIPLCWISVVYENILSCLFFTSPHQSQWHTYTYNAWQKSDLVNNSNRLLSSFFLLLNLVAALEWRTASQSMSYDAIRIIGILFLKRWLLTRDALNHKWYSGIAAWTSRASLCKWRFFIRQTQHHRPFSANISLYGRV